MLNDSQIKICKHWAKPFIVEAPAGTGKTFTIRSLIEAKIEHDVPPEEILALTFTNLAKRNLQKAIEDLGEVGEQVNCNTLHGLCLTLLRQYSDYTDYKDSIMIANMDFTEEAISLFLSAKSLNLNVEDIAKKCSDFDEQVFLAGGDYDVAYRNFCNKFSKYFKKLYYSNLDFYKFYNTPIDGSNDINAIMFIRLYKHYRATLLKSNHVTFNDLLSMFEKLLLSPIGDTIRKTYTHIILDESQDTTEYEFKLLFLLLGKDSILQLFGDRNQLIYEWRGINPITVYSTFKAKFPNYREFSLDITYRSYPKIAELNNQFLVDMNLNPTKVTPCQAILESGELGATFCTPYQNLENLQEDLPNLLSEQVGKTCILCKTNAQIDTLVEFLKSYNIYPVTSNILHLHKNPVFQELISVFKFVYQPLTTYNVMKMLKSKVCGIDVNTLSTLTNLSQKYKLPISYLCNETIVEELEKSYVNNNLIVLDIESNGLNYSDDIVQIAAVAVGKDGVVDEYVAYVSGVDVGESVTVHHITNQFLAQNGIPLEDALDGLSQFYYKHNATITIGHNIGYDVRKINYDYKRLFGCELINLCSCIDTLILTRNAKKLPSYKLEDLSVSLNLNHASTHNAYDDILATYYLFEMFRPQISKDLYLILQSPELKYIREVLATVEREVLRTDFYTSLNKYFKYIVDSYQGSDALKNIDTLYSYFKNYLQDVIPVSSDVMSYEQIAKFIDYISLYGSELNKIIFDTSNLFILTEFASKGLEFDNVIYNLTLPYIPKYNEGSIPMQDRRVFYTAMSRAKKNIHFIGVVDRVNGLFDYILNLHTKETGECQALEWNSEQNEK